MIAAERLGVAVLAWVNWYGGNFVSSRQMRQVLPAASLEEKYWEAYRTREMLNRLPLHDERGWVTRGMQDTLPVIVRPDETPRIYVK
jgi:hypothetical protein